jgi:enamine deaminase RidA (YjgF/YER057c/UK114 family)
MDRPVTRHRLIDVDGLPVPVGFSYAAVPVPGRTVYLAGITAERADGTLPGGLADQFEEACRAVAQVVAASGGEPGDVVSMTIYTTDVHEYRASLAEIGKAYRSVFGKHYPPAALLGVEELFHPEAKVELVCVAVVPGDGVD